MLRVAGRVAVLSDRICFDSVNVATGTQNLSALRVVSTGAGLDGTDDAYVGLAAEADQTTP